MFGIADAGIRSRQSERLQIMIQWIRHGDVSKIAGLRWQALIDELPQYKAGWIKSSLVPSTVREVGSVSMGMGEPVRFLVC